MTTYKIVIVGAGGVGKTAFVRNLMDGTFYSKYIATIGVEVHFVRPGSNTTLAMWDCAGQEKFQGLAEGYYVNAQAAILMYSAEDPSTRDCLEEYAHKIREVAGDIPLAYVANKCDLVGEFSPPFGDHSISVKSGEGVSEFMEVVVGNLHAE